MKVSIVTLAVLVAQSFAEDDGSWANIVSIGQRPYYLVDEMKPSSVRDKLDECAKTKTSYARTDFSIGHRGACMQFPEHTLESYKAAALQGAGVIECDVTFTKDRELVCRHSQCDLHTTTDIVLHSDLNANCTTPWSAGVEPMCCTSDFTLEQIKTLCGKMDSSGINATTPEEYVYGGTPDWRTDLYQYGCPTIVTHKESIELIQSYGGKFTPELKGASVEMPYEGDFTQEAYAQKMIDEYVEMGIDPKDVWPQSFNSSDVFYWIQNTDFGDQAVMLDETEYDNETQFLEFFDLLVENGVKIIGPYLSQLVEQDDSTELGMKASAYSEAAVEHGFQMIAWSLERSGPGLEGWYWSSLENMTRTDGDQLALLYFLTQEIGNVIAVFSDWPATTTFFGNCYEVGLRDSSSSSTSSGGEDASENDSSETTTTTDTTTTPSPSSPAGSRRHLQAASQMINFALKLVGI
ncbi:hypothetical protein ACHAWU_000313 [Discostella pseudostelligera]|uniref:glycerophosphodiester phosphodiesterase n=1 Tax=Discostella pseudostelligera TaxID=259834 RepID=A0ABD3MRG4_9STRA